MKSSHFQLKTSKSDIDTSYTHSNNKLHLKAFKELIGHIETLFFSLQRNRLTILDSTGYLVIFIFRLYTYRLRLF